jgi:CubicO group peptidase (beta-lactamase class C family)
VLVGPAEIDRRVALIVGASGRYRELMRAFVVTVDGQPVAEHYGQNGGPEVSSNIYSVIKSVISMLIGIAISDGSLPGIDATVGELLPTYRAGMASGVADVTVRQLLTMTGGVIADENLSAAFTSDDWVADVLATPLDQPAGRAFGYSGAGYHLLAAIIVATTGQSPLEFARERLFGPLGIITEPAAVPVAELDPAARSDLVTGFGWSVDPKGINVGYSELRITANDMAKLGQLYLDQGQWQGRQLVPASWVVDSTSSASDAGYGYGWWIDETAGHPYFAALGQGGQTIDVVPDLGLVVAITAVNGAGAFDNLDLLDIVAEQIVPAVGS